MIIVALLAVGMLLAVVFGYEKAACQVAALAAIIILFAAGIVAAAGGA